VDDVRFTDGDGKCGFLAVTLNPMRGKGARHRGVLILGRDITQRRLLESQLTQAQKLEGIGQLAAGIAHEINTPMQYVGDNARFLKECFGDLVTLLKSYEAVVAEARQGTIGPESLKQLESTLEQLDVQYLIDEVPPAIQQSLEGIQRVTKIVRAMRDFSHPGVEEKAAIDINKAIESTITISRNEWKYVAEMETDLDADLPPVLCLPGELNQVILNLIVNAASTIADVVGDGSKGKGAITICTRGDGDRVEIRVSDTGAGIPEEIRANIFDPFFTTKEVGRGTGQGLAIAHSVIADKHAGTISFETETGKGTTFIIRLPIDPTLSKDSLAPAKEIANVG
jgi:signal transduction histidine kinase